MVQAGYVGQFILMYSAEGVLYLPLDIDSIFGTDLIVSKAAHKVVLCRVSLDHWAWTDNPNQSARLLKADPLRPLWVSAGNLDQSSIVS